MATTHEVAVTIGSGEGAREVAGWDEIAVTLDLLSPGSPWTVTIWRPSDGAGWDELRRAARLYAPVTVKIDREVQLRGELERLRYGASRGGAPLTLSGRDLAGAAMSSDLDPRTSLRGVTLAEALTRIFGPLGIPVTVGLLASEAREVQAGSRPGRIRHRTTATPRTPRTSRLHHRVDRFKFPPGTKVWQAADTLCRRHGFLLYPVPTSDGIGLVVDRPEYESAVLQHLTRRRAQDGSYTGNILEGFRDLNGAETPTRVTVFGRSGLDSRQDARHRGEVENETLVNHPLVSDVLTYRNRYIQDGRARTPQAATQRARRELARAMAAFDVYEATAQGFIDNDLLWAVNTMVRIDDDVADVHGDWLVTRVTFSRARSGGHVAHLRLVPKGALVIEPDPEV